MILTRKRLLVDVFLTRKLSKSFAFYELASVNFESWIYNWQNVTQNSVHKLRTEFRLRVNFFILLIALD